MDAFLASRKTTHHNNFNFQSMKDKCNYNIESLDMDEFLCLYKKEKKPGILQRVRPGGHISVRGDFDIKLPESLDVPYFYNKEEVVQIVEVYQQVIRKLVKNINPDQLTCYVLEKSVKKCGGYQKKGFHLEFPYLFLPKHQLKCILFPEIKKQYNECQFFSRWNEYPQKIFDEPAVISNPWYLYGSSKEDGEPYLVSYRINSDGQTEDVSLFQDEINVELFFINPYGDAKKWMRECFENTTEIKKQFNPLTEEKKEYTLPKSSMDYVQEISKLSPLIGEKTMTDFDSWMNIKQCIFDLTNGSLDGLNLFIELSKKGTNFNQCSCISHYMKCKPFGMNIGVLINYAKRDSPVEYERYRQSNSKNNLIKSIQRSGQLTTVSCAETLYMKYRTEFLYNPTKKEFYQFHTHRWNCIDKEGHELMLKIQELKVLLTHEINRIREKITDCENDRKDKEDNGEDPKVEQKQIKELDKQRTMMVKERNRLEDTGFREKIIKECRHIFLDREFETLKDMNPFLIGFTNGVLDLQARLFRDGRPSDYITMTTKYDYVEQSTEQIDTYMDQLFVKNELKVYALNFLASCLEGFNKHKKMHFLTGVGDNGKTLLQKAMSEVFGGYYGLLPRAFFIGINKGATPELNKVKKCRLVFVYEFTSKDTIDIGILKELTGNDAIQTRQLYNESDSNVHSVFYKLVGLCNETPQIDSNDRATWNRIRELPFESRFIENPNPENEYEFKVNKNFEFSLEFKQAFMTKLFKVYCDGYDPYEPEPVKEATKKFQSKNDSIQYFIRTNLVQDDGCHTTLIESWTSFREFWKSEFPDKKFQMEKSEFINYLVRHFKLESNTITGYRQKEHEEEVKVKHSQTEDQDIKQWNELLKTYQPSDTFIRQKDFFKTYNIHSSLGRKKFPTWFQTTEFTFEKDSNSNKLFIQLKEK